MGNHVVTIETERTLLRPFTLEDSDRLYQIVKLPEVMQYIAHPHQSIEESYRTISRSFLPHYEKYGFGRLAIALQTSGELIGYTGLKCLEEISEIDLAYLLHPQYWKQGLATEVAQACLLHATKELRLKRVISLATPNNTASLHVLNKLGMRYEKNILFWGEEYEQHAWVN